MLYKKKISCALVLMHGGGEGAEGGAPGGQLVTEGFIRITINEQPYELRGTVGDLMTSEPVAIVIDEAHNICPAEPGDPLTALVTADALGKRRGRSGDHST